MPSCPKLQLSYPNRINDRGSFIVIAILQQNWVRHQSNNSVSSTKSCSIQANSAPVKDVACSVIKDAHGKFSPWKWNEDVTLYHEQAHACFTNNGFFFVIAQQSDWSGPTISMCMYNEVVFLEFSFFFTISKSKSPSYAAPAPATA